MEEMLSGSNISSNNYDKTLIAWSKLPLKKHLPLSAENLKYTKKSVNARQILTNKFKWYIMDAGEVNGNSNLKISNIKIKKLSKNSSKISWKLNHNATAQIEYGLTKEYGSFSKKENSFNHKAHTQTLSNLKPNTTYHYRIISEDKNGKSIITSDATFVSSTNNYITPLVTLEELKEMIRNNDDVTHVNTSKITTMSYLFYDNDTFNQDISNWDVSNVTDMYGMFEDARDFNQPLEKWNVSNVTNMKDMFILAETFNQPLEKWNVSNVTDMSRMFYLATSFNQPISTWDVSNVTDMQNMFMLAEKFNQSLENWDVSNVKNMSYMFNGATKFNQPLEKWDVSNVTDMSDMFTYSINFNQPLEKWDVSNVTDISSIFWNAKAMKKLPTWYTK